MRSRLYRSLDCLFVSFAVTNHGDSFDPKKWTSTPSFRNVINIVNIFSDLLQTYMWNFVFEFF